jgi:hypothetical protein
MAMKPSEIKNGDFVICTACPHCGCNGRPAKMWTQFVRPDEKAFEVFLCTAIPACDNGECKSCVKARAKKVKVGRGVWLAFHEGNVNAFAYRRLGDNEAWTFVRVANGDRASEYMKRVRA